MSLILQKLGIVVVVLLFSSTLSLAANPKDPPICVPGDTKCLHPEQPLKEKDMASSENSRIAEAILVDDDDEDEADDFWDRVEEDREREHEWHEDHEDYPDRDIEIDFDLWLN